MRFLAFALMIIGSQAQAISCAEQRSITAAYTRMAKLGLSPSVLVGQISYGEQPYEEEIEGPFKHSLIYHGSFKGTVLGNGELAGETTVPVTVNNCGSLYCRPVSMHENFIHLVEETADGFVMHGRTCHNSSYSADDFFVLAKIKLCVENGICLP